MLGNMMSVNLSCNMMSVTSRVSGGQGRSGGLLTAWAPVISISSCGLKSSGRRADGQHVGNAEEALFPRFYTHCSRLDGERGRLLQWMWPAAGVGAP
jgi:hypothetical protein